MITLYKCLLQIFEADEDKIDPKKARDDVKSLANDNDTADDIIHKMYTAGSKELQNAWSKLCGRKNYTTSQGKQLLDVLMDNDLIDLAAACINDDGIVEPDQLLSKTGRFRLSSFLDDKLLKEYNLSNNAVLDIIKCQPSNNGVAVGPGEMFLTFVIKGAVQNGGAKKGKNDDIEDDSEITGDIRIGNIGLEIKGSTPSFFGQKGKPNHGHLRDNIKSISRIIKKPYPSGSSKAEWATFFNEMMEYYQSADEVANNLLNLVYEDPKQKPINGDYIKLLKTGKFNGFDEFMMSAAAFALKQYQVVEGFDSVMFIQSAANIKNPTALIIRDVASKSIKDIYKIFAENFVLKSCFDFTVDRRVMPKIDLKS